ncbi:MAG: UDP-N-acetylmuramate dehydrogenase [Pseudomonadota bacterium]
MAGSGLRASVVERFGDTSGLRGRLTEDRPLAPLSWLRVGGAAELFFQPADREDLAAFLQGLPGDVPVTPLGVCSNLIIRDGGLPGVSLRLGRAFAAVEPLPGARLRVGAGALDSAAAKRAAEAGIAGLEFLRTIPGSIGGAVKMNAGCYGSYTADVVERVTVMDRSGQVEELQPEALGFGYRHSAVPDDQVVLEAVLQGVPGDPTEIAARMEGLVAKRAASQPVDQRSCGSTFRNPAGYSSTGVEGDPMDLKAWKLIEEAGCRGMRLGGAQISEKHANFLVNAGGATAADLEDLGDAVRARVKAHSGHDLVWEIARIGVKLQNTVDTR